MASYQLGLCSYRNESLFASHYLDDVLPASDELWAVEEAEPAQRAIQELWRQQAAKVAHYSEAQLEEHFIKPVLEALGHIWEVQPIAGDHRPDYAFFSDEMARARALPKRKPGENWSEALAVGDAKAWDRRLDKALKEGSGWDFQNPSFQIVYYLAETRCKWAILTNGHLWRLYCGEPKADMRAFYEVDLLTALQDGQDGFPYFWLFFRREAFIRIPGKPSFLDRVRAESDLSAEKLRDDVKDGVYRALLEACRGFLDTNGLARTPRQLSEVYDHSLVLLYRLLFVLYAEAADLLPLRENAQYQDYSLQEMKAEVVAKTHAYSADTTILWHRLSSLFSLIDKGNEALGVPAYNGGLFDSAQYPFLETHSLSDQIVAKVVELLASGSEGRFVDYRDLGVRHLGSIYEGLLEYRLASAAEPMAAVREKGREKWVAEASVGDRATKLERCPTGGLYLVTDKGERKATGSFYTPQFIVDYMVKSALGPLVDQCSTAEEILDLRVLDLAMGSGHFLVEATDYLAQKLLERGLTGSEDQESDAQTDLTELRRVVVERCIYGVDINPLAVELAKLSLWLNTVAKGRPLSFLDHHLRCGNSLVGARASEIAISPSGAMKIGLAKGTASRQLMLFDDERFRDHLRQYTSSLERTTALRSDSREIVKEKGRILKETAKEHQLPYKEIADVWCSWFFDNQYDSSTYDEMVSYLQGTAASLGTAAKDALSKARQLARDNHFFHWDLEFPDVFQAVGAADGSPGGFHCIVGNPPYVRVRRLRELDEEAIDYYESRFETAHHVWDVYMLMFERAAELTARGGRASLIVPIQVLHQPNARGLRALLLEHGNVAAVVDLGAIEVFSDAIVKTAILCFEKCTADAEAQVAVLVVRSEHDLTSESAFLSTRGQVESNPDLSLKVELLRRDDGFASAIEAVSQPLGTLMYVTFGLRSCAKGRGQGSKDRLITECCSELTSKPYMEGREIDRYSTRSLGRFIRYLPEEMYSPRDPRLFETPKIVSRSMLSEKRLVATLDREGVYVEQSLLCIIPHGVISPSITWLEERQYSLEYLVALLNSRVMSVYFATRIIDFSLGGGLIHATPGSQQKLPIRIVDFSHPSDPAQRRGLLEKSRQALDAGDYCFPVEACRLSLAAHAALYGPAGKKDLLAMDYWSKIANSADPNWPGREDFVHDLLGELTEIMLAGNDRKLAETSRFMHWLEWYCGLDIDVAKRKASLLQYYALPDSDALLDVLQANKSLLGKAMGSEFCATVSAEFEESANKVKRILLDLGKIDCLIDEIVESAYGVTAGNDGRSNDG